MKSFRIILVVISMLISGCVLYDNTDVIEIDFVSKGLVTANGKVFPLQSNEDGGRIIAAFPNVKKIKMKNIQNAMFSDIWKFVDCRRFCMHIRTPIFYEVVLPSGKVKEIKFNGRMSDPLWFGQTDTQIPITVRSDSLFKINESYKDKMTYLQIMCEVSTAKGFDIQTIIEMYLSYTNYDNDVYLLAY